MKSIILVDMDGTITEPRQKIERPMIDSIRCKSKDYDFGIVTGSDMDYVQQQCADLLTFEAMDLNKLHIFPCNGTKHYKWDTTSYKLQSQADMRETLGHEKYKNILMKVFYEQMNLLVDHTALPYTGTFLQYRGSLLNWCPIGRDADNSQRRIFEELDKEKGIREKLKENFQMYLTNYVVGGTIALGGSTSFDIYPNGWDKTYVLRHLEEYDEIYFIGDRCREGGNDKALYDALSVKPKRAFETTNTDQTREIICRIYPFDE